MLSGKQILEGIARCDIVMICQANGIESHSLSSRHPCLALGDELYHLESAVFVQVEQIHSCGTSFGWIWLPQGDVKDLQVTMF